MFASKAKINSFGNFLFTPKAPSGPLHSEKFHETMLWRQKVQLPQNCTFFGF